MIIDSHCHALRLWPFEPPVPDAESRGTIEQLLFEMDENGVDQAVVICARIDRNLDNNDYVADEARKRPKRLHHFADVDSEWADTYHTAGAADRLASAVEQSPIKGFTHYLSEKGDRWLSSEEGLAFFRVAAERNLIASLSASPGWQPEIRKVAQAFPTLPIICHHLGFVPATEEPPFPALREVLQSASLPNVLVKVSGYYYGAHRAWDFPYSDSLHIIRALYEHFGPYRLCWGSDYPVVRKAITYRQAIEVLRTHCPFIPDSDKDWILGKTMQALLETRRPIE
jgi:L-fuconolactonase